MDCDSTSNCRLSSNFSVNLKSRRLHDVGGNDVSGKVACVCDGVDRRANSYSQALLCGIPEITAESKMTHGER